ncbi:hypothetical protein DYB36_003704 [Aphanomyces astaci]|uniref:Uncharacterized protein n=1 Tax=Aphanomyces astaci TaxID=112090 RepID=A0A397A9D2_APHAT|nr:hypothetical protein DYB36_003704 [Aphanomyces astaci]
MGRTTPTSTGSGKPVTKKELQDIQYMVSAYSDLTTHLKGRPEGFAPSTIPVSIHVLGPHLDLLHAQLTATIQKAKADLTGCKTFVHNYAMSRIQSIVRGRRMRAHHTASLVTTWFGGELAAAVLLQCFSRTVRARWRVAECRRRHQHRICMLATIHMQRTVRGYLGRKVAATKRVSQRMVQESHAVVTLQCWVRCLMAFRLAKVRRDLRDAARARVRRQEAALNVQRVYRGHVGRVKARQAKIQRSLSDPVRNLVAEFQATGDLWAFVQAVDKDYRQFDRDRQAEEDNATTFVTKVLRERMLHQERSLLVCLLCVAWHASRAMASPVVAHQRRLDSAYESPLPSVSSSSSPGVLTSPAGSSTQSGGGVVAPHSLFELTTSDDAIHMHQIAPETIDLPDKYPPHVIRHAMAQGYAVDEIIAALRGLEAQGKSTRNVALVLRELKRRTPLMLNAFKSERVVRQQRHKSPPKHHPLRHQPPSPLTASRSFDQASSPMSSTPSSSLSPSSDTFEIVDMTVVTTYLLQMLPDGLDEPMAKITFAAAMLVYIPPLVDVNGGATTGSTSPPWTSSPNSHFAAYVNAPSALLQVVHGADLDRIPTPLTQLQTWGVPVGVAHSLVHVLKCCRRRQQHIDPRYIRQQTATSPARGSVQKESPGAPATPRGSTADTVAYDVSSRASTAVVPSTPPTPPDGSTSESDEDLHRRQFAEMKTRIEATALTPLGMDSSLFDLFFQALFVVLPTEADLSNHQLNAATSLDARHLDTFVYQLLDPALSMHASHRLLKRRSQRTATMARAYSNACKAANCHSVKDIVNRSLEPFHVPDVLAEQVRVCIGKVLFPPCHRDVDKHERAKSPKQLAKLMPLHVRMDSPLVRSRGKMPGMEELPTILHLVDDL